MKKEVHAAVMIPLGKAPAPPDSEPGESGADDEGEEHDYADEAGMVKDALKSGDNNTIAQALEDFVRMCMKG